VGPSLIEIAKLYPQNKSKQFVKWCVDPGKKRPEMAQMPSMAHIPEADLLEIQSYIIKVAAGRNPRVKNAKDNYKKSPTAISRPRVTRSFFPNTGPASMALPTKQKLNAIWDTDVCQLRYISHGEIDNFPYLKSNGNSLAKVGKIIYTETPLFKTDAKPQFKGYEISNTGFPTLHYSLESTTIKETYSVEGETVTRIITASPNLPDLLAIKGNKKLELKTTTSGNVLTIIYKPL